MIDHPMTKNSLCQPSSNWYPFRISVGWGSERKGLGWALHNMCPRYTDIFTFFTLVGLKIVPMKPAVLGVGVFNISWRGSVQHFIAWECSTFHGVGVFNLSLLPMNRLN